MERTPQQFYDELLVLRCQDGEVEAFEALVSRRQSRLAISRGIGRLQGPACFRQWACQIVTRPCADWARKSQRDRRLLENAANESAPVAEQPTSAAENDEQMELLRAALRKLPGERRALLTLFSLEQLSSSFALF